MTNNANKVAIVTGGATLIGQKVVEALVADGCRAVVADINTEDGAQFADALSDKAMFVKTDVTSDADIDHCIELTTSSFGGVDYLVNVAATYLDNGIDSTRDEWLTAMNTNLIGAAMFSQKVAPVMRRRGGGAIVLFGSISGKVAQPGRMLYAVTKAGILGMTRNLALHLAPDIRVNSVSPGWTWSNPIRDFSGNNRSKADAVAEPMHLAGRLVDPEEVGAAVAFLCSDKASGITGTDLAVDGGYRAIGPEQKTDKVSVLGE